MGKLLYHRTVFVTQPVRTPEEKKAWEDAKAALKSAGTRPPAADLFGHRPRAPRRIMMHAIDTGEAPGMQPGWRTAKGAAQLDYEQRIRSALVLPSPPLSTTKEG